MDGGGPLSSSSALSRPQPPVRQGRGGPAFTERPLPDPTSPVFKTARPAAQATTSAPAGQPATLTSAHRPRSSQAGQGRRRPPRAPASGARREPGRGRAGPAHTGRPPRARARRPGALRARAGAAISAAHWLLAAPPPPRRASLPSAPPAPAFPASRPRYGKRRGPIPPGAGSRERRGGAAR